MQGRPTSGMRFSSMAVPALVVLVAAMLVVPVPAPVVDALLAFNLAGALVILLVALEAKDPLQFSVLPSLLLLTTLLRLAVNVSTTRLVMLTGNPGAVIHQFGEFVIGGNPVAGFVVFAILLIIQFVIITKGAERVSEVAARFTLDAMPGKQLSIDADLGAGLITEAEARARRQTIEREADFYGAMDGASKFVKGDAIASIIITVVNLLGGFLVGVLQQGMSAGEALSHFSLLTVGDGLVTQIPALLMSTATGIVVTRAASEGGLGSDLLSQLFSQPMVLFVAGGTIGALGLVPGLPHWPFLLIGGLALAAGYAARRRAALEPETPGAPGGWPPAGALAAPAAAQAAAAPGAVEEPEKLARLLRVDPLELELGLSLLGLSDPAQGGDLLERVSALRRQVAGELGLLLPAVRLRDNLASAPEHYTIKLRGVRVAEGDLMVGNLLALHAGEPLDQIPGIETREPAFDLPALWIASEDRSRAEAAGYTLVEPPAVLITHLSEVIRTYAHELLGRQEVKAMIEATKETNPALIEELTPELLSLGEIQRVLQNLLREGISIRDTVAICESLATTAPQTHDPDILTERVRAALGRAICHSLGLGQSGETVRALVLAPETEQGLAAQVQQGDGGHVLILDPAANRQLLQALRDGISGQITRGETPLLTTSPLLRLPIRRLTEAAFPRLTVLSYAELDRQIQLEAAEVISL